MAVSVFHSVASRFVSLTHTRVLISFKGQVWAARSLGLIGQEDWRHFQGRRDCSTLSWAGAGREEGSSMLPLKLTRVPIMFLQAGAGGLPGQGRTE